MWRLNIRNRSAWSVALYVLALSTIVCGQNLITTLVGTEYLFPGDARPAVDAPLGSVEGVAVDRDGSVYFSDIGNAIIAKLLPDRTLQVVGGNGLRGFSGDGGPAQNASFSSPRHLAFDTSGDLYVTVVGRIRKISRSGTVTTIAGGGTTEPADGIDALQARFTFLFGIAVQADGTVYFSDYRQNRVWKLSRDGQLFGIAGDGNFAFQG